LKVHETSSILDKKLQATKESWERDK
jgi:hypothetical protein